MSTTIMIGIVVGLVLATVIFALRRRTEDIMPVLLVIGVAGVAIAVTVVRVQQYRDQQAAAAAANESVAVNAPASAAQGGPPAMTNGPPREPIAVPVPPPGMHPATGGAAPPAAPNPYAKI